MLHQVALYLHTARHLRPEQVSRRVFARLKKQVGLPRLPPLPNTLKGGLEPAVAFCHHEPWNSCERIREGQFCFLNREVRLGIPVDWRASGLPLLWQFNLHYFGYLHLLSRGEQVKLCAEWARANPVGKTIGWHPYPTSLRIVNWSKAGLDRPDLLESLYQQAAYLYRSLETYHPSNHLLENAKALIFAGRYFRAQGEATAWLRKGLEIYRLQTPIQVLKDGGYFERSPMYHAIMLEGYLDIINILPREHTDRPEFVEAATRMSDFLVSVTHPDGNIALLNDSTFEIAPPTQQLLEYTHELLNYRAERKHTFTDTGYFIHQNEDVYLIMDGGPIGPDFLPAHAHADIFSYELSLHGHPFIVDSGVYEYPAGAMRSYVRSTRAHNTVCIDKTDQAECWSSFRVARRFAPYQVSFHRYQTTSKFEGYFGGYSRLIGEEIVHRRLITCDDARREILVQDTIEGKGTHLVESLLHLHPDVSVEHEGSRALLKRFDISCRIETAGQSISAEEGWYCPQFGLRYENKVLVVGGKHSLPVQVSYLIRFEQVNHARVIYQ